MQYFLEITFFAGYNIPKTKKYYKNVALGEQCKRFPLQAITSNLIIYILREYEPRLVYIRAVPSISVDIAYYTSFDTKLIIS